MKILKEEIKLKKQKTDKENENEVKSPSKTGKKRKYLEDLSTGVKNKYRQLCVPEEPKKKKRKLNGSEMRITLSSVKKRKQYMFVIQDLGWTLLNDDLKKPLQMTHLVLGHINETVKLYVAIIIGAKIVKPEWLEKCYEIFSI